MAISVTHTKVNQIADWTQEKLNELINAGVYPAGTLISDITQPSDWNDDHTSADLDNLEQNVRGMVIIDMGNDDYTMTAAEAKAQAKVILNSGDGTKTLTSPTTSDGDTGILQAFVTTFAGSDFYYKSQTNGNSTLIRADSADIVGYDTSTAPVSIFNSFVSQDVFDTAWNGRKEAPSMNAIYDALVPYSGATTAVNLGSNTLTTTGQTTVGPLKLPAGTATANTQPIEITSGTLLTSAEAGSIEYDGTALYSTPVAGARGVSPSTMFAIVPAGGFALSTGTGVQSCFPAGTDVWTLQGGTTYKFEGFYHIQKATNTSTVAMAFALGGGASVTSIKYYVVGQNNAVNVATTAQQSCYVDTVASTIVNATSTGHTVHRFTGIIRMNAGGTITPQIDFSNTTAGSPTMMQDSYIMFTPIGTNTVASCGAVA